MSPLLTYQFCVGYLPGAYVEIQETLKEAGKIISVTDIFSDIINMRFQQYSEDMRREIRDNILFEIALSSFMDNGEYLTSIITKLSSEGLEWFLNRLKNEGSEFYLDWRKRTQNSEIPESALLIRNGVEVR